MSDKVTYLGKVDFRNKSLTFGIKEDDRTRHTYVIGKTGMGKSTFLENMIIQDINNGEGVCVMDPHGSMAEKLLDFIPESRIKDVVYFAPFDDEFPIGLNVLEKVDENKKYLVANGLMAAFKKLFVDQFSARMEYILNNIILALLENEGQTLLGVNRMLFDKEYRKFIVSNVKDPTVKDFWINEYANYTEKTTQELAPAIQNKVGQFVSNPLIRNIIGQKKTSFDVRKLMDEKKILIINLSKGKVGEGNANLLGSLLITKIYLAAMSRADAGPYALEKLPPFYFYVDEFQNFANESFASILSEARKYKLALTVAHQYVEQMTDEVKAAVFGNVGTMVVFRVGATDAEIFEKEFAPYFIMDDIVNLSAFQIYLRLMIDGVGSKPFSASTLSPIKKTEETHADEVIAYSRNTYSRLKKVVEEEIADFYIPMKREEVIKKPAQTSSYAYAQAPAYKDTYQQQNKTQQQYQPQRAETHNGEQKKDSQVRSPLPQESNKREEIKMTPPFREEKKEVIIPRENERRNGERRDDRRDDRRDERRNEERRDDRRNGMAQERSETRSDIPKVENPKVENKAQIYIPPVSRAVDNKEVITKEVSISIQEETKKEDTTIREKVITKQEESENKVTPFVGTSLKDALRKAMEEDGGKDEVNKNIEIKSEVKSEVKVFDIQKEKADEKANNKANDKVSASPSTVAHVYTEEKKEENKSENKDDKPVYQKERREVIDEVPEEILKKILYEDEN